MKNYRPLRFTAHIGKNPVQITDDEVNAAIAPARATDPIIINFHDKYAHDNDVSWAEAAHNLEQSLAAIDLRGDPLAVFAIGPIPLLIALGGLIGDKLTAIVYERHRHRARAIPTEAWCWEESEQDLEWEPFHPPRIQRGATDVAIMLSISGTVDQAAVTKVLPLQLPLYEISLLHPQPNRIRTPTHLSSFVTRWREVIDHIRTSYGDVRVHVFPAIPVSVAVECGRQRLQADPTLHIYNATGNDYHYALSLGPNSIKHTKDHTTETKTGSDILIIVALGEEFTQLRSLLPLMQPHRDPAYGNYYYTCSIGDRSLVIGFVGSMGTGEAQLVADRAIERWRPLVVVWVGIAAGIHKDIGLTDVIVPDHIDSYDANQKVVDSADGGHETHQRGEVFRADHALIQDVRNYCFANHSSFAEWQSDCAEDLNTELQTLQAAGHALPRDIPGEHPRIKVGHIASGNKVIASPSYIALLHQRDQSLLGIEMETAGLTRAAYARTTTIRTLAIRGVSDFGDERKATLDGIGGGLYRRVAMRNACRLLLRLIDVGIL